MKRKKKKPERYAVCPCCGQQKHKTEVKTALRKVMQVEDFQGFKTRSDGYGTLMTMRHRWACDACFNEGSAITSNHQVQYCSTLNWPHMAYFDTKHECRRCNKEFVFSKEEKRFWFEELQFYVEAQAVHCLECRTQMRTENEYSRRLSVLLKKGIDNLNLEDLEKVIGIYEHMDKKHKVAYYRSAMRRLALKEASKSR